MIITTGMVFGELNGHATGMILKELVRRAIKAIRNQRIVFEVQKKDSAYKDYDIVTSADKAAQAIYLKKLQECFPQIGIVAEEDNFRKPCGFEDDGVYFSVDPLDGTKAFGRRQSHGIGTQIALRVHNDIVSAYVGDVMTQEIYGFRPGSENVWRINEYETYEKLTINLGTQLKDQYLLMRENPEKFDCQLVRKMNSRYWPATISNPLFKDIEVEGGSIGLSFARLWKGEVGGLLMAPYAETPWDTWPTIGISLKMGFAFFSAAPKGTRWERYIPCPSNETEPFASTRLVIHKSRIFEMESWQGGGKTNREIVGPETPFEIPKDVDIV